MQKYPQPNNVAAGLLIQAGAVPEQIGKAAPASGVASLQQQYNTHFKGKPGAWIQIAFGEQLHHGSISLLPATFDKESDVTE